MKIHHGGPNYATHLDVLNDLFGKDLRQHSKATSPLRGAIVWFPHVSEDDREAPGGWINRINCGKDEIREYWPTKEAGERQINGNHCDRVVFGRFVGAHGYTFLGVFRFAEAGPDHIRYVRTKTEIDTEFYWPMR